MSGGHTAAQRESNFAHDVLGHRLLYVQEVIAAFFIDLRPEVAIAAGIDEIGRDANLGPVVEERSLEHGVHVESFRNFPHGHLQSFVLHDGGAGYDTERRGAGQSGDELVGHSIDDVVLIGVLGQVDKGQDGDGMESAHCIFGLVHRPRAVQIKEDSCGGEQNDKSGQENEDNRPAGWDGSRVFRRRQRDCCGSIRVRHALVKPIHRGRCCFLAGPDGRGKRLRVI